MAITNRERIDKGLEQTRIGLTPFVERELKIHLGDGWESKVGESLRRLQRDGNGKLEWDTYALFKVMWDQWHPVFRNSLGSAERNYVSELSNVRNDHAHEKTFGYEDAERYLDTMRRLLQSIGAPDQAELVTGIRKELIRVQQAEEARRETRKFQATMGTPVAGLRPWREVITPHDDVAKGRYMEAEFAADLDLVHKGKASPEYSDPREFFARTFLTEGLKELLTIGARRLTGQGADPVVELQTNFGGGKTHSMLALYHLFGGTNPSELAGLEELLRAEGITTLPKARRAVLVGVNLSAAEPRIKPDGCEVRTMWGDMAWQLGGKDGFALIEKSDRAGTSPGKELLEELLRKFSPCLVLIDEWVALLRQLPDEDGLPAGSFGANITFAQALTEAAKGAPESLVVASLPQSSIEVGGTRGEKALGELSNVIKRIAKPWRPANTNEGFEIVRRRLFQSGMDFSARDAVVKAFSDMYRDQPGEFPPDCRELDYRKKMEASYPIHPELFQQFEQAWGTLEKFQRTRGILRLMAAVIHELWQRDDRNLLVMPSSVTLDSPRVMSLITECLPDGSQWEAVISKDIDGPQSLPQQMDADNPNLGRYSAARRVARTIFMGSAPTVSANSPGIDEAHLRLGCAQPGETVATFGDALRRLTDQAVHLYVDKARYWYSLKATVSRLARERAEQFKGAPETKAEIVRLLRLEREKGEFSGLHVYADSDDQVDESFDTRLVLIGPEWTHSRKKTESTALKIADEILTKRGNSPRIYRNTLVFLAADARGLAELETTVQNYLAWKSIRDEAEKDALDLSNFAKGQARTKTEEYERACKVKLAETWSWALVPSQHDPMKAGIEWEEASVTGSTSLAPKVSRKLVEQENVLPVLGAPRLKMELDKILWKSDPHVNLKHVADCFATYLYLPRLTRRDVLLKAVESGFADSMICEYFGYASSFDGSQKRYAGLQTTRLATRVQIDGSSALVKPEVAAAQAEADKAKESGTTVTPVQPGAGTSSTSPHGVVTPGGGGTVQPARKTTYFGSKSLTPTTAGLQFSDIQKEIVQHLVSKLGVEVTVTVEITARFPEGFDQSLIRTVSENAAALKLDQSGFSS
jgi:predicted AAA+ superfamily ATPase